MLTETHQVLNYRSVLLKELAKRKSRNSSYSVRAFSRDLGISKTTVAAVLAGKRHFSREAALKVAEKLALTPRQTQMFLSGIKLKEQSTSGEHIDQQQFLQLKEDQFRLISDWYHFGILALARVKDHSADPKWIAKRLAISDVETRAALETLQRLGLIEIRGRKLIRTTLPVETTNGVPSAPLRRFHRQNLMLAEGCLESVPIERRVFSSINIPVDLKVVPRASELIQEFKVRFAELVDSSDPKEIYTLAIQFFPITKEVQKR